MLLAKLALGFCGTIAVAGVYTFHEGVMRVDEDNANGSHVHVWVPAAVVPLAVRAVPARYMDHNSRQAAAWLPVLRALTKELRNYPEADFIDVQDSRQHVHIRTHKGKLLIDVTGNDENVHVVCPLVMVEEVSTALESKIPAA